MAVARQALGIQEQHHAPGAIAPAQVAAQLEEARAVVVLPREHDVGVLADQRQAAAGGELSEDPALRVDRNVRAVLARADVGGGLPHNYLKFFDLVA